jgi:hypothetical protein
MAQIKPVLKEDIMKKFAHMALVFLLALSLNGCGGSGGGSGGNTNQPIPTPTPAPTPTPTPSPNATAPTEPRNVSATAIDAYSINVYFNAPTSDGGSSITSYTAKTTLGNSSASGISSPIKISGLTPGMIYTVNVTATNSVGTSTSSMISNIVETPSLSDPPVDPLSGSVKNGNNSFLAVNKSDGVYLQKYSTSKQLISETRIQAGNNFFTNYTFSPETSSSIFIITTKAVLDSAGKPDRWDNNGESFLSVIDANSLSLIKTVSILPVGRIMDTYHFKSDSFFQMVTLVGQGQYLKRFDLNGNILINKPLWAGEYWFNYIRSNATNVYLAGNKYKYGFGERACIMMMDRDLNVLGDTVHKPFATGVGADTIIYFKITDTGLLISINYDESATIRNLTTQYSVDFTTGTFTPI